MPLCQTGCDSLVVGPNRAYFLMEFFLQVGMVSQVSVSRPRRSFAPEQKLQIVNGVQFSATIQAGLWRHQISHSMVIVRRSTDNALTEHFCGTIKREGIYVICNYISAVKAELEHMNFVTRRRWQECRALQGDLSFRGG